MHAFLTCLSVCTPEPALIPGARKCKHPQLLLFISFSLFAPFGSLAPSEPPFYEGVFLVRGLYGSSNTRVLGTCSHSYLQLSFYCILQNFFHSTSTEQSSACAPLSETRKHRKTNSFPDPMRGVIAGALFVGCCCFRLWHPVGHPLK